MNTVLLPNSLSCKNCKHYEYIDSKQSNNGFWNWGLCHHSIKIDEKDDDSIYDIYEYFQVTESHFCAYFETKK